MTEEVSKRKTRERASGAYLLDAAGSAAEVFGCSERTFYTLRQHPKFPAPVILGPRIVRYRRDELIRFVEILAAEVAPSEPAQLVAGKARKRAARVRESA